MDILCNGNVLLIRYGRSVSVAFSEKGSAGKQVVQILHLKVSNDFKGMCKTSRIKHIFALMLTRRSY